jgi:hypothetical protein
MAAPPGGVETVRGGTEAVDPSQADGGAPADTVRFAAAGGPAGDAGARPGGGREAGTSDAVLPGPTTALADCDRKDFAE